LRNWSVCAKKIVRAYSIKECNLATLLTKCCFFSLFFCSSIRSLSCCSCFLDFGRTLFAMRITKFFILVVFFLASLTVFSIDLSLIYSDEIKKIFVTVGQQCGENEFCVPVFCPDNVTCVTENVAKILMPEKFKSTPKVLIVQPSRDMHQQEDFWFDKVC
jgi:hypothetical protein